jgi:putative membrane protein
VFENIISLFGSGGNGKAPAARPGLESLEDRTTPAVIRSTVQLGQTLGPTFGPTLSQAALNNLTTNLVIPLGVVANARGAGGSTGGTGSAGGSGSTGGTGSNGGTGSTSSGFSAADRRFLAEAARGDMLEIRIGELAAQNSSTAGVQQFGLQLVADHTSALQQVRKLVAGSGMHLGLTASDRRELQALQALSGTAFDQEFLRTSVAMHQQTIARFQREARQGNDARIRAFARSQLPALQEHLQASLDLIAQLDLGGTGGT